MSNWQMRNAGLRANALMHGSDTRRRTRVGGGRRLPNTIAFARPVKLDNSFNAEDVMTISGKMLSFVAFMAAIAPAAYAADADKAWPDRTVRIITGSAGGPPDAVARTLADEFAKRWKKSVIVENRPGADFIIAARGLLEAQDGHTLLLVPQGVFTVNPLLYGTLPYDPERDFAPISLAAEDFLCVAAAPSPGVNSLSELVKLAASKPGELSAYALPPGLAWLAFQKRAGISTTLVPYKAPTGALMDLSADRIHVALLPLGVARGQAEAGKIKILAVTNAVRAEAAPEIPTVAEAGYPDLTLGGLLGLFGPKDMPHALQERIASEVHDILKEPEAKKRLINLGLRTLGTTPAEFRSVLDEERAKWAAIARALDIKPKRQ
jgi:tripartite-type tricarboxylate transporter receptor subunit TctC